MSREVKKGLIRAVNSIQATVARSVADRKNQFCLPASMVEVGSQLNTRQVTPDLCRTSRELGIQDKGTVPIKDTLSAIKKGSDLIGVPVSRITIHSGLRDRIDVPDEMEGQVSYTHEYTLHPQEPFIVVLAHEVGKDDNWAHVTHAETVDGSKKKKRRFDDLISKGWEPVAIVEFDKK